MRSMSVEDAMTVNVEMAKPSDPVTEVAKAMAEEEIGSLPKKERTNLSPKNHRTESRRFL